MAKLQKLWLAAFAAVAAFGVDFLSRNGYIFLTSLLSSSSLELLKIAEWQPLSSRECYSSRLLYLVPFAMSIYKIAELLSSINIFRN